ncbi:MAG TPA: hypothetical protein VFD36_17575 [Kofleriaceae bacterium]|nr:hypothetical protein [Kofleriaceae bacterium]
MRLIQALFPEPSDAIAQNRELADHLRQIETFLESYLRVQICFVLRLLRHLSLREAICHRRDAIHHLRDMIDQRRAIEHVRDGQSAHLGEPFGQDVLLTVANELAKAQCCALRPRSTLLASGHPVFQ